MSVVENSGLEINIPNPFFRVSSLNIHRLTDVRVRMLATRKKAWQAYRYFDANTLIYDKVLDVRLGFLGVSN